MPKFNHPQAIAEIAPILGNWQKPNDADVVALGNLTTKSLDTVTHLTEYEDEKANRILTAMAFISAFAGALFVGVIGHYSSVFLEQLRKASCWRFLLVESSYGLFVIYAIVLSVGVALSLYGMRPRFNYPKSHAPAGSFPRSLIFFEGINAVSPTDWANAFTGTPAGDLAFKYVKNNVLETYLISGKVPVKLAPLRRASTLYIASTCILVLWVVLSAVTVASIDLFPNDAVEQVQRNLPK